jgi:hypothetical protein
MHLLWFILTLALSACDGCIYYPDDVTIPVNSEMVINVHLI